MTYTGQLSKVISKAALAAGVGLVIYSHLIEKRSTASLLIEKTLAISHIKKFNSELTDENFQKLLEFYQHHNEIMQANPQRLVKTKVKTYLINDMKVFVWNDHQDPKQKVIFYLHGGTYVMEANFIHYLAMDEIVNQTDAKIIFPVYPLAPKFTFKDAYPKVEQAYRFALQKVSSPDQISLIGDSAGGGFALGLALLLKQKHLPQPKNIILISPWLDVRINDDQLMAQECQINDPILDCWVPVQVGKLWAGGEVNTTHPLVSPFFGDLTQLGYISIFVGTHEMIFPHIKLFSDKLAHLGIKHNLIIKEKMNHNFPLFPIPEGREARQQIADIINGNGQGV